MSSRDKTERLLNLTIALLATRRPLTRAELRRMVPGYPDSDEAFERMFERDKDDLREMGVPVETGATSALFDDELGYRIRSDAYALPEMSFTREEMAVLTLAAQAWAGAALAGPASSALLKLKAYAVETDEQALTGLTPRVGTHEPAFRPLWQAVRDARCVRFDYRKPDPPVTGTRTVEPWALVCRHGRWYVVGHDRDRGAARVFRLSRIDGPVTITGAAETERPAGANLAAMVAREAGPAESGVARLRLRVGAGAFLRRAATLRQAEQAGWDSLELPYGDLAALAADLASLGPDVVVVDPPRLREAVIGLLRGAAGVRP